MKFGLVLTNDWEVYGDGSGDYFEIQHKPLMRLLDAVADHGGALTVMAEVGQQWAHQALGEREAWARETAEAWEGAVADTVRRGMDVQLHLHPQWLDATRVDGRWQVDFDRWALPSLDADAMASALLRGKRYLEELLQPVKADYACVGFRAGSWCVQPSHEVVRQLRAAGLVCDTSVAKGMYEPPLVDFRNACSGVLPWLVSEADICAQGDGNPALLEMPICAHTIWDSAVVKRLLSMRTFYRLALGARVERSSMAWVEYRSQWQAERHPPSRQFTRAKKRHSLRWWLSKILARRALLLDYDDLPASAFVRIMEKACSGKGAAAWAREGAIIPVVASGHVKSMPDCDNIHRILDAVSARFGDRVVHWTLSDAVKHWSERLSEGAPASGELASG